MEQPIIDPVTVTNTSVSTNTPPVVRDAIVAELFPNEGTQGVVARGDDAQVIAHATTDNASVRVGPVSTGAHYQLQLLDNLSRKGRRAYARLVTTLRTKIAKCTDQKAVDALMTTTVRNFGAAGLSREVVLLACRQVALYHIPFRQAEALKIFSDNADNNAVDKR